MMSHISHYDVTYCISIFFPFFFFFTVFPFMVSHISLYDVIYFPLWCHIFPFMMSHILTQSGHSRVLERVRRILSPRSFRRYCCLHYLLTVVSLCSKLYTVHTQTVLMNNATSVHSRATYVRTLLLNCPGGQWMVNVVWRCIETFFCFMCEGEVTRIVAQT